LRQGGVTIAHAGTPILIVIVEIDDGGGDGGG